MNKQLPEIIASEITGCFTRGLDLDEDIRHFFVSCEGLASSAHIAEFLNNCINDSSPVYDLIFYPDREMRLRIESLIPAAGLDTDAISNVISAVCSTRCDIIVNTVPEPVSLEWSRFSSHVYSYIKKLNLDINTGIFHGQDAVNFIDERIILRSGRYVCSGESAEFLGTLARRAAEENLSGFIDLFIFALKIIGCKNTGIPELFEISKCFYEAAISDAAEFSRILGKYSMEYVMARKINIPLISLDEAAGAIRKIDTITSLVYGFIIPAADKGVEMLLKNGELTVL
ncbi:MAG TPA: hypothetical protein PK986_08415 [Spirochaetota bacterium]|nr:hypothetical protein [Spirochaetota bacterium]